MRLQALRNALQFLLVLGVEVRPQHILCRVTKEAPFALGVLRRFHLVHLHVVFNLSRQQVTMLKADLLRRAL